MERLENLNKIIGMHANQFPKAVIDYGELTTRALARDDIAPWENPTYSSGFISEKNARELSGGSDSFKLKDVKEYLKVLVNTKRLSIVFFRKIPDNSGTPYLQIFFRYIA